MHNVNSVSINPVPYSTLSTLIVEHKQEPKQGGKKIVSPQDPSQAEQLTQAPQQHLRGTKRNKGIKEMKGDSA